MTWLTTSDFILYTGINMSSDIILNALQVSERTIMNTIFISTEYQSFQSTTVHQIFPPIMSIDGETTIGTGDVIAYESNNLNQRVFDLTTSLVSVDQYSGLVTFTSPVPTGPNNSVVILYKRGQQLFGDMLDQLKELEKLLAVNYIYNDVIHKKMQGGISSWNINGVSVSFDANGMEKIIDDNLNRIKKLYSNLRPRRWDTIKPGYAQYRQGFIVTGTGRIL